MCDYLALCDAVVVCFVNIDSICIYAACILIKI